MPKPLNKPELQALVVRQKDMLLTHQQIIERLERNLLKAGDSIAELDLNRKTAKAELESVKASFEYSRSIMAKQLSDITASMTVLKSVLFKEDDLDSATVMLPITITARIINSVISMAAEPVEYKMKDAT